MRKPYRCISVTLLTVLASCPLRLSTCSIAYVVKWLATRMGIEKLVMKNGKMTGYFIADQNSPFYQSARFQKLLLFVQRYPNQCRMQEKETRNGLRLLILFDGINTVYQALKVLQQIEA